MFPTACAMPSVSISSHGCGRTVPLPPARWSASPIRALTPPMATLSWPRRWAPSRSTIPVTIWSATHGPCSPTVPPPALCAATVCRRHPLPTRPMWTSAPRRWGWIRWLSGCRILCRRDLRTVSATTSIIMTAIVSVWRQAASTSTMTARWQSMPRIPAPSAAVSAWPHSGTTRRYIPFPWKPVPTVCC